ncbi:MAG: winged helix-turn-helix domain-containing protein [Candidatus Azobacteroides sp.]|nr:winged helix-turn-helix domain-containing protein [Candidatus Azobacteroides sp.]
MKEKIGNDAGCVWKVLDADRTPKSVKELKRATKLTDKEVYAAIGWLAREEKLAFQQEEDDLFISLA